MPVNIIFHFSDMCVYFNASRSGTNLWLADFTEINVANVPHRRRSRAATKSDFHYSLICRWFSQIIDLSFGSVKFPESVKKCQAQFPGPQGEVFKCVVFVWSNSPKPQKYSAFNDIKQRENTKSLHLRSGHKYIFWHFRFTNDSNDWFMIEKVADYFSADRLIN